MKVLVTGSEGSLMQAVIPLLIEQGHHITGVDSFFRYGTVQRQRPYEFIEGDLCDEVFVRRLLPGVEVVLQGAARIFGVAGFHAYPADILSRDVTLHQHLLWAGREMGLRKMVYISSSMVYERCESVPSREEEVDDMRIPHTDYGLSKLVGERLCRAFAAQYGLRYTIYRPFNIITPFEKAEEQIGISHVFADFIERLILRRENPLKVLGDGEQVRCFTWIGDVARGITQSFLDPRTDNQAFNLGNPEPITMRELARKIFAAGQERGVLPRGAELRFTHLPTFSDDVRVRVPAVDKARDVLGWSATVKVDEAVDRCVRRALEG
jgi:UDP-glucose 4-epimerase